MKINCKVVNLANHYARKRVREVTVTLHAFLTSSPEGVRSHTLRALQPWERAAGLL